METPTHSFFQQIRHLIQQDELPEALRLLHLLLKNSPLLDEALHHSGRWQHVLRQVRLGVISHENATLTKDQMRWGLLEFLREIEVSTGISDGVTSSHPVTSALRAEVEKAVVSIVNSKNVATGNVTAGGNVTIGDTIINNHPATSKWLMAGAVIVIAVGLMVGIAEFSGYPVRDIFEKPTVVQPTTKPSESDSLKPQPPIEVVQEKQEPAAEKPKPATPRNHFESKDESKQINVPDNQGTIHINQ